MESQTITLEELASNLDSASRYMEMLENDKATATENADNVQRATIKIMYSNGKSITYYAPNKESINEYIIKCLENTIKTVKGKALKDIRDFKEDQAEQ